MGLQQHRWFILLMFFIFIGAEAERGWAASEETEVDLNDEEKTVDSDYHRKIRKYCSPSTIEQFPRPLIGRMARRNMFLMPEILAAMATLVGLAVVSKHYYVSSLLAICEKLKLTPDVVGATFMAAGSSAPQLTIVIIGYFCAYTDQSVNSIVGLSAYNMLFVPALCALTAAGAALPLNWRPFCRDCFFYAVATIVMLVAIINGYVYMHEALFMVITYGIYCVVVLLSRVLGRWICCNCKSGNVGSAECSNDHAETELDIPLRNRTKPMVSSTTPAIYPDIIEDSAEPAAQTLESVSFCSPNKAGGEQPAAASAQHKATHNNSEVAFNPIVEPKRENQLQLAWIFISYPAHWACRLTIPDPRGRWYIISYLVSVLWLSLYAFFFVWMIVIIVFTLGITDPLMSLTFVPVAVSVPNVISSLVVVKKGYGDMVTSNAIGSCVFNMLVCLGLPWLVQTAVISPGSHINVISKGFSYTCSTLVYVVILLVATLACGRKLDRKYGVTLMLWYLPLITLASLYELNYFGEFNPPDCYTWY